jgi:hypothetical protein
VHELVDPRAHGAQDEIGVRFGGGADDEGRVARRISRSSVARSTASMSCNGTTSRSKCSSRSRAAASGTLAAAAAGPKPNRCNTEFTSWSGPPAPRRSALSAAWTRRSP